MLCRNDTTTFTFCIDTDEEAKGDEDASSSDSDSPDESGTAKGKASKQAGKSTKPVQSPPQLSSVDSFNAVECVWTPCIVTKDPTIHYGSAV